MNKYNILLAVYLQTSRVATVVVDQVENSDDAEKALEDILNDRHKSQEVIQALEISLRAFYFPKTISVVFMKELIK